MEAPQSTLLYVHVRRELVEAKAPLEVLVEDINAKIRTHGGIILADRQFLRRPISTNSRIDTFLDEWTSLEFEQPEHVWGEAQRRYFGALWGLTNPYQYASEREQYNEFYLGVVDPTPYLVPGETILALVGTLGEYPVDCPCHFTQVVYTSRHRIVCMGCGHLYRVLAEPLDGFSEVRITAERWDNAITESGELVDDDLEIPIVDFRRIEQSEPVWSTDFWDEVSNVINLYASGNADEIAQYERGFPKPDDLIAAGFQQIETPPSLAHQLSEDGLTIDLHKNSGAALKVAAAAYGQSRTNPEALREAVLSAFQATELILKMRLSDMDPSVLKANNPTVVRRLLEAGVIMSAEEQAFIDELRRLRNMLQHDSAELGYRATRRLLRGIFIFLDRFVIDEFDFWLNHVCDKQGWTALLDLPPIQENADRVARAIAARAHDDDGVEVAACEACARDTVIMFNDIVGHCLYCRWEPPIRELEI